MRSLTRTSLALFALVFALGGCAPGEISGRRDGGGGPSDGGGVGPRDGMAGGCYAAGFDMSICDDATIRGQLASLDSDSDGLTDADEICVYFTNPCQIDSDGDGVTDLAEVAAGTDPRDRTSRIDETRDFFVVLPYYGDRANRPLRFGTTIEQADVFFLVDMTGSMQGERTNLIRGLIDTIIPGVQAAIPNVQVGAGGFDDYPYGGYGGGRDLPFYLLREIAPAEQDVGGWSIGGASATVCPSNAATNDIGQITGAPNGRPDILEAVEGLPCHGGADGPESYGPALWATATGMGLTWPGGMIPGRACTAIPDEIGRRRGYPCFRPGSLPIILLFGDAPFHNGPGASPTTYSFPAPAWTETVMALNGIGARVLGIYSGGSTALSDYQAAATATGTVRADGSPLVFSIAADGTGLSGAVVDAVAQLVGGTPQDVSTTTENVAGNPDEFDARLFIKAIRPVEGYGSDGIPGARPGVSYTRFDETTFYGVIPGTIVEFAVDFYNDVRMPAETAQVFQARIIVLGNGVARLDERRVFIIVPPDGGVVLI